MKSVSEFELPAITPDEKRYAMLVHVCVLAGLIFPGVNLIGPLVIYFVSRKKSEFVRSHAATVLNFWIVTISMLVMGIGYLWVSEGSGRDEITPLFLMAVLIVFQIFSSILYGIFGLLKAHSGGRVSYPLAVPMLK